MSKGSWDSLPLLISRPAKYIPISSFNPATLDIKAKRLAKRIDIDAKEALLRASF
jgi:hypothetical protein